MDNPITDLTIRDFTGDFSTTLGSTKSFNVNKDKKNTLEFIKYLVTENSTNSELAKNLNPLDYKLLVDGKMLPTNEETSIDVDELRKLSGITLMKKK